MTNQTSLRQDDPEPTVFYGLSLAAGSPERQVALDLAGRMGGQVVWASLDPLSIDDEPPDGVVWLRLGEPGLVSGGWRACLAQVAKLLPALQALGASSIQYLSGRTASVTRILALLLRWSTAPHGERHGRLCALPGIIMRIVSPARAARLVAEAKDGRRELAGLLDASWYGRQACPGVQQGDGVDHYLSAGQYAGLDPHPLFWTRWYARKHLSGIDSITPWRHFIEHGLNPNPFFVMRWYRLQKGAGVHHPHPLLDHAGHARLGTSAPDPNPLFDTAWYARRHALHGIDPLTHFILNDAADPTCPFLERHPEVGSASGPHGGYATAFTNSFAGTPSAFPVRSSHRQPGTADDSGSGKFAVCCVLTGRYDTPQPVGRPEPNIDYFLITDAASLPAPPGWQRITVPGDDANPLHLSRRLKMNLASLLPSPDSYDAIVYLDGNIEVAGDIRPLVSDYLASGADLGVVPHPFRQCVYEEAAAVMLELRDDPRCVLQAVEFLEHEGHPPRAGLFEMNFFCFRPRPAATAFFAHWWQHYQQHGNRDQLLAPYVARKLGTSLHPLLPTGRSVRTHAAFRYHPHLQ